MNYGAQGAAISWVAALWFVLLLVLVLVKVGVGEAISASRRGDQRWMDGVDAATVVTSVLLVFTLALRMWVAVG
jgi:hypothetical protein